MSEDNFAVELTESAEADLVDIITHARRVAGVVQAQNLLGLLEQRIMALTHQPERGAHPRELLALGIREYRQIILEPYRIVYRIIGQRVIVYLIADGRRNMQALLERRLIGF